jgi:hypothetical protein
MADIEWLPARQLREIYVDPVAINIADAQRRLYLAVVTGEVRARLKSRILNYKQVGLMSSITPFNFPADIGLSVEDARRKWGGPWLLEGRIVRDESGSGRALAGG